jgi:cell division septation protein DedD
MKRMRNILYLSLLSALLLFAGTLTLRGAAAQQPGDQADSSSTKKSSKSKQTPASPAPAAKPAAPSTPAAGTPAASKPAAPQQTRPANNSVMVWVNTDSGIYHKPGTRYFGKTKQGKYMSEADAIKAGYRAAGKK